MNYEFWKGKKVFLTGHTGFKGGWTALWLAKLGATVKGYALPPIGISSLYESARISNVIESELGDIRDFQRLKQSILNFSPEIVIHMAAQPLVLESYRAPVTTYETNIMGTVNLLEALRSSSSVRAVVNVTTDKCYQNNEWLWGYREDEPMGGNDPYSSSKACSELITSAFRKSFFGDDSMLSLGSARAGNVIGGGDWAENRLIPDVLKSFDLGNPVVVRNPSAVRPWQHVLEPVAGYLTLAEKLYVTGDEFAEGWNFGPNDDDAKSVSDIMNTMVAEWPSNASWIVEKSKTVHESQLLKLDISKAKTRLGWSPRWNLDRALQSIIFWHFSWVNKEDMRLITLNQISDYEKTCSNAES